ncbi:hypothetical protein HN011_011450 [Eciton burchellii]|nr:hypothetical protein HN011_011450 [Eciton burchellii]
MKTFLFVCLLAIAYASDPEKLKAFSEVYAACNKELNVPDGQKDARTILCLTKKEKIYDNGEFSKDKSLAYLYNLVPDANRDQIKEILTNCIEQVPQGSQSNDERSLAIMDCTLKQNIMDLFDI